MFQQVIDCWAKSGEGTLGARKAEALLQEMQDLRTQYDDPSLAPNLITFNSLLNVSLDYDHGPLQGLQLVKPLPR